MHFSIVERNSERRKAVSLHRQNHKKMKNCGKNMVFSLVGMLLLMNLAACAGRHSEPTNGKDASVYYQLALAMLERDSVKSAEQLLHKTIRLARETQDSHTLYLAQLQIAQLMADGNVAAATDMAREALATYERHPDSERNHIILLDYVATYASQVAFNDDLPFDDALAYAARAYKLAVHARDTMGSELVCQTLTTLANIHWATENYGEALRCAREAESCASPELLLGAQQVLGRCLLSADSLEQAEAVYRRMEPGNDVKEAYIIQSNLAKIALRHSRIEEAEDAIDEAFDRAEELYFDAMQQKDEYYRESLRQQRDNERMHYASALHRRTMWGVVALALICLVAGFLIMRNRMRAVAAKRLADAWRRKHEVDERIHETIRRNQEERFHRQQIEAQHEQLRQRDGTIAFLQDFILRRSETIKKLEGIAEQPIAFSDEEWQEVERTIDAIDGDRFQRIRKRYPNLREEDIQVCILTRLRLPNRAIGNLFSITVSAAQHRKLKLKKEIFGEDDPDVTLEQVLAQL